MDRELPGRGLGAVLAELERERLGRLGPGAADALEAVGLVLPGQCEGAAGGDALLPQDVAQGARRTQPPAGAV